MLTLLGVACHAEDFDTSLEAPAIQNIQQLTFTSMGFEKAGEAYFPPDGKTIIFQAVPTGQEQYQMFTMDLNEGVPQMVSTGKGACTCGNFSPDGKKIIFASSHENPQLVEDAYSSLCRAIKRGGSNYSWEFTPYINIYQANTNLRKNLRR